MKENKTINVNGLQIVDNEGDWAFGAREAGGYEEKTVEFFKERSGDVFFDIGSRNGWHGLHATMNGYRSYFFEPSKIHKNISKSIQLNGFTGVIYPVALSDEDGTLSMVDERNEFYVANENGDFEVPCLRFDSLFDDTDLNEKTVSMKIDVEGHEGQVLEGIGDLYKYIDYLVIEYHPKSIDVQGPMEYVESRGFDLVTEIERNQIICFYENSELSD